MTEGDEKAILTLEPLIEAVKSGVEADGWELSGLQKTTSYRFEGRWEGDSTRSAYLFFHRSGWDEGPGIDVYLDETSRGLKGNLALVLDAPDLGSLGQVGEILARLAEAGAGSLPEGGGRPLTLRFRIGDVTGDPAGASTEVRFKVRIPREVVAEGVTAVSSFARTAVAAFEALLRDERVRRLVEGAGGP